MSISLAAALATMTLPSCSWDRPGADPFMGDVVAAVDRYTDIPAPVRAKLKARMEARQYDEIAAIRRDSVTGKRKYAAEIRDMHFGEGQVCRTVTRAKWADNMIERGLVYCESGHCILVPTVCRNVSRIKRLGGERVAAAGDEQLPAAGNPSASGVPTFPMAPLEMGSGAIPPLLVAGGGGVDISFPWLTGTEPGGVSPGIPGTGGGGDNFGPLVPLPGWGGGGGGGGGPPYRPPPGPPLSPVPEPGTWLMTLLGLAAVAGATRLKGLAGTGSRS